MPERPRQQTCHPTSPSHSLARSRSPFCSAAADRGHSRDHPRSTSPSAHSSAPNVHFRAVSHARLPPSTTAVNAATIAESPRGTAQPTHPPLPPPASDRAAGDAAWRATGAAVAAAGHGTASRCSGRARACRLAELSRVRFTKTSTNGKGEQAESYFSITLCMLFTDLAGQPDDLVKAARAVEAYRLSPHGGRSDSETGMALKSVTAMLEGKQRRVVAHLTTAAPAPSSKSASRSPPSSPSSV